MASNYDTILAQTNPQALAVHTGYSSLAPTQTAPRPTAPAPKPSLFHSIAQAALHNKVNHTVGNVGKGLVTSTVGAAKTVGQAGIVNPAKLGAAEITHNTVALNNVGKSIVQNTPGKVIGAGLQTASLALPGPGKLGEALAAKGATSIAARAAATGVRAAPAGALFGAGQSISQGKKPLQVAKAAAVGGLTAGVLGSGGSLLGSAISRVRRAPLPLPEKSPEINATPVTQNKIQNKIQNEAGKGSVQNTNVHPDEQFAKDYLKNNYAKATKDYQDRTMKEFGTSAPNIVSGDEAKFVVPNFTAGKSGHYHEPASTFAKDYYKKLLADPATKDKPVLITGGGAGAGKTSGLRASMDEKGGSLSDYAAVNDTNLTDLKSAENRIEPALKSGRKVEINYVYRDPVDSFVNGNIPRAEHTGRIVPIETHAETHAGSLDTIKQVAEKYKDDPRVSINIVDNSRGANNAKIVPLDFLKDKSYNKEELTKVLHNELEKAKSKIKPDVYNAYKQGSQESGGAVRPSSEQTSSKNLSKVGKSVQQKAVEQGLKDTFGDSATYEKISLEDQAKRAVDLTNNRSELEKVISGEKPLPQGLRATALIKAVEDHPVLGKDPELLNRLSKSDLNTESSQSAQELRLARERNPDSVTARLNEVRKAKIAAVEAKLKTPIAKAISSTAKEIKDSLPAVKRQDWHSFVDSLQC